MPFGPYDDFDSCVSENSDKRDPEAYCSAIKQEIEGEASLSEEEREHYERLTRDHAAPIRVHRNLQLNSDTVRRMETDDGAVTYENIAILAAGEWTDGATEETVYYSPEALSKIASDPDSHVVDNAVNVNHEHSDQLKQVGHFDPDSLSVDGEVLYADITLHRRTQASTDTAELVDLALETKGEQGAGGPSVEIPFEGEVSEFDRDRGMERLTEFNLSGLSIVTHSASEDVSFEEQFSDRAVAMNGPSPGVRVMSAGQTALTNHRHTLGMDPITELDALKELDATESDVFIPLDTESDATPEIKLADGETVSIDIEGASIEDIRDALTPKQELQGDDEVAAAVDEYLANDGSPEDGVDEFLSWAQANLDMDVDALEAVAADYLAESGAEDLSETPVSEFMAFINDQDGEEEPENGENPEDEEMADELSSVKEENRELRAIVDDQAKTIETVTDRLEALEDRPDYTEVGDGESEEEGGVVAEPVGGLARDGDWIAR